jgi:hypothetical protein
VDVGKVLDVKITINQYRLCLGDWRSLFDRDAYEFWEWPEDDVRKGYASFHWDLWLGPISIQKLVKPEEVKNPLLEGSIAHSLIESSIKNTSPQCHIGQCSFAAKYEGWARKTDPFTGEITGHNMFIPVCEEHKDILIGIQSG